jgi:Na+/alanine symporter
MLGDKVKEYSMVDAIGGTSYAWVAIAILLMAASAILWWYITGDRNKTRNNTLRWK